MQDKVRNGIWNLLKGIFFKPSWEYVSVMWFLNEWFLSHCSSSAYFFFNLSHFLWAEPSVHSAEKKPKEYSPVCPASVVAGSCPHHPRCCRRTKTRLNWKSLQKKKMCHSKSSANRDTIQTSFCVHKNPVQYQEKITVKEKHNVISMILHKGVFTDTSTRHDISFQYLI